MGSVDRYLTAASYLVSLTGIAMATSASGALGAGLGALTSLNKLHEKLSARVPDLNRRVAESLADALARTAGLPRDADLLIPQMIEFGALTPPEVMAAGRTADGVCAAMLAKLTADPEHRRDEMRVAFATVVRPILVDLLNDEKVSDALRPAFETAVMQTLAAIAAQTDKLVEASDRNARQLGVQTGMLVALARTYAAGEPEDFDSAYRGLERALQTAAEMRTALPSNLGEAVDRVIARVNELNAAGQIPQAGAELRRALAEQEEHEAEAQAATIALLRRAVDQAILERSVPDAATCTVKLVDREGEPETRFDRLRVAQDDWYVRGRDKGLNFDLEVATALAREEAGRAKDRDQRGAALNDLGNVLGALGEREPGTARLEEAVEAYRLALEEGTRERVPLDWAITQMNLGSVLQALGEREPGTARLEEAVEAYRLALEERTRERVPLDWAMTQMNLGSVLGALGEREPGTARLEEAVEAYRLALEERTRERVPLDWAMTQMNLAILETVRATRAEGAEARALLDAAAAACSLSLEVFDPRASPYYHSSATDLLAKIQSARASLDAGVWPPAP